MKKFILLLSMIFFVSCSTLGKNTVKNTEKPKKPDKSITIVNASTKTDANLIYIYNEGTLVGTMTINEFRALVKDAKSYNEILKAEKEGRIKVVLKDNPWKLDLKGSVFTTYLTIYWKDTQGKQLKKVVIKITLDVPKEGKKMSKLRVKYRDIAEVVAPTSLFLLILLILVV